ncbi:type I-E CRISPR-associated protein Cse1/CasA [Streptodolium elevatio]
MTRMVSTPSFDLVDRPWLPVLRLDGTSAELSLREVFSQADDIRRLVGDVPTQEFALMRLLLAVAHDVLDGPADLEALRDTWERPFVDVPDYLDRNRERFDLLHPTEPFFQVPGLRTAHDEVASLNRIVADVPNGEPFFTMRLPDVARLGFAEAARWVVHAQAFDTSGIKSGAVDDSRVKSGKGYPLGVAWAGNLGGVFAEGRNLRETLLLNLVASDAPSMRIARDDKPAWRRPHCGPGATRAAEMSGRPSGPRDLYTWQSRRLLLHHDGTAVTGVVLAYGDPLAPGNGMQGSEPMTGWRRSKAQEKKLGRPLVYMPREHDPTRAAWRGLAALLFSGGREDAAAQRADAADSLRPRVLDWIARLANNGLIPNDSLIRARTIGAVYGTQQSVIDETVDDSVTMCVVLLHEGDPRYGQVAVDAVADAHAAVVALGGLAADLAQAAGADAIPRRDAAMDIGYASLDGPFRSWLRELGSAADPFEARRTWQRRAHGIVGLEGDLLLASAGQAAREGRLIAGKQAPIWLDDTAAELWFRGRLKRALHEPFGETRTESTEVSQ